MEAAVDELDLYLNTQYGWSPRSGPHAYLDALGFAVAGLRSAQATGDDSA